MKLAVKSRQKTEFIDITRQVSDAVAENGLQDGFCHIYVPHTTAGVTINESADPAVAGDILMVLNQVVPWQGGYGHMEGNSPAHIKASLIGASEWVACEKCRLLLGTWQGIFFCEFDGPRSRRVQLKFLAGA